MLQELLLALSGHPSPLLSNGNDNVLKPGTDEFLSPAETTLLTSLSNDLGQKHSSIRAKAYNVVTQHASAVCRAVCVAILSNHLPQFQQKILEVERSILNQDPSIVGAYNIVPLSAIVAAFDGWDRKLEWLWRLVSSIQTEGSRDGRDGESTGIKGYLCTASAVIEYLRDATHTGNPDIEQLSLDLVKIAETAWLKQLALWLLYGKLPSIGAADFFIVKSTKDSEHGIFILRPDLIPPFVDPATASSILFVGKSLSLIKARGVSDGDESQTIDESAASKLRASHLQELQSLKLPVNATRFTGAIRCIRLSLSKNILRHLLPLPNVIEVLRILKEYFLLGNGDFALALISAADERLVDKQSNSTNRHRHKGSESLSHLIVKEAEVGSVLARAWTTLASVQGFDNEDDDDDIELARQLIELSLESKVRQQKDAIGEQAPSTLPDSFQDLLLPTSTLLTLRIQSPLDLFLTPADVATYSRIHAYLLALRRSHLHLSKLFTLSALRRDTKSRRVGKHSEQNQTLRRRAAERGRRTRSVWATVRSAAFLLATISAYFQAEVIQSSWEEFHGWLDPSIKRTSRPPSRQEQHFMSRLDNSMAPKQHNAEGEALGFEKRNGTDGGLRDPERLMLAHKNFLDSLCHSLLLRDSRFTSRLRTFMTEMDHFCALMDRLEKVQQNVDVEICATARTAPGHSEAEEEHLFDQLDTARRKLDAGLAALVKLLQEMDIASTSGTIHNSMTGPTDEDEFLPTRNHGLDRLLLQLDFTSSHERALLPNETDAYDE
ncbi:MAG: hypothetical protein LQ350_000496 [Teloschistes chrysophthalmus]|nr:MAG: hypothetical protein LQ350_000496 [Niorma chrysophthalma]